MGDLCINGELTEISTSLDHVQHASSEDCLIQRPDHCRKYEANCDAATTTGLVDPFQFYRPTDDIFNCLLTLTSYISHRFIRFIEDLVFQDVELNSEDWWGDSYEQPYSRSFYGTCRSHVGEEFVVNTECEVLRTSYYHPGVSLFIKGLLLPLSGLKFAWRLALGSCRCLFYYIRLAQLQVHSIISRVHKTLRGSSEDIGWLQRTPGMPPIKDGTARFIELLEKVRNGEHKLPDTYVYLLIPGLFSNHGPLYFVATKRFFSKMGLACHIAKIHSEASVEHNAWELKQYIEELYWGSGKRVMLLGHSKGGVDAAAALSMYWSDLKEKVAGLALVQSPYGGSPLASDILREGQIADKETRRIMELLICKLIKGDIRALEDLTYDKRREFITRHKLPEEIPLISFHSEASIAPGVLATMTQIAHAELPWLPLPRFTNDNSDDVHRRQVPVMMPLSAAMALTALHLELRYGEKSDGLVTCCDSLVPGSVIVKPDKKLDHGWMVYSSWSRDPTEPDPCEMCEALLTMLVEIGNMM